MSRVEKLNRSLRFGFSSKRNILTTFSLSFLTYLVIIWASNPTLASRTLSNGLHYSKELFLILSAGSFQVAGLAGFLLIIAYSLLSGIAGTNLIGQIQNQGLRNIFKAGGIIPGIAASGCAGCGVGLAALFGVSGAFALMPFNGNLIRLGGTGLLLIFLSMSGDPRKCEFNAE